MTQTAAARSWCLGLTLQLVLAAVLHQSFATVAPPITAQPTAAPHLGRPERGHYQVNSSNGTACLLASMGLQLNITFTSVSQNKTVQDVVNLQPNLTTSSGSCEPDSASLRLTTDGDKTSLTFFFTLNITSSKYHLSEVSLSAAWPDREPFSAHNRSLDYLRGTLGYSYMCRKEQTLNVAQNLSINTFQVQVQPFGLSGDQFGTGKYVCPVACDEINLPLSRPNVFFALSAEECQLDEDDMLIPIIVGAALAGLVLIVLLAYLIGRKRSHAGYQTI
ncbi:hypothetical protein L3Q82_017579 [Scortum barcoo]|uniref:Uncharacterized protein n=1 Tax=Scortum barcoo TaxID=214431 RepID=A0ACB8VLK0_9TELE|nr:hypothetical protein L3Q82_017579 [Scortum barcoo]